MFKREQDFSEVISDHYLDLYRRLERGQLLSENCNFRYTRLQLQMYRASLLAD